MKDNKENINSIIKLLFEKRCQSMVEQLRDEVNHGESKCERYMMKLFIFIIDETGEESKNLMAFPYGMPQHKNKHIIFKDIGHKLYKDIKENNENNKIYQNIYSIFLISEIWAAIYNHPIDSSDLLPSERSDRKEYFFIVGQDILNDKFVCQIELKRYQDHILAGNEVYRELSWNDDKSSNKNNIESYILDYIFQGYAEAFVKDRSS